MPPHSGSVRLSGTASGQSSVIPKRTVWLVSVMKPMRFDVRSVASGSTTATNPWAVSIGSTVRLRIKPLPYLSRGARPRQHDTTDQHQHSYAAHANPVQSCLCTALVCPTSGILL